MHGSHAVHSFGSGAVVVEHRAGGGWRGRP